MKPTCIICDLDHTLAIHPIGRNPKDHSKCEKDIACEVTKSLIFNAPEHNTLIFLTKCSTKFQLETYNFLKKHFNFDDVLIIMRDDNDESDSPTFKKKKLEYIKKHFKIKFCIEDDDRNIKTMKEMKLKVIDIKKERFEYSIDNYKWIEKHRYIKYNTKTITYDSNKDCYHLPKPH